MVSQSVQSSKCDAGEAGVLLFSLECRSSPPQFPSLLQHHLQMCKCLCVCVCVFALGFSVIAFHYVFLASPPWVSSVPPHNHMIIIMTVKVFFSHPVYLAKTNIANIDRAGIYSHLFCFFCAGFTAVT